MQALLIECVIRSSLIAAFAGLVLSMMRIKAPAAKHVIWTGVMLAMLILPALIVWGPRARLPVLRPAARSAAMLIPSEPVGQAPGLRGAPGPASSPSHTADCRMDWPMVVYLAGVLVFLIRLGIGMARVNALLG